MAATGASVLTCFLINFITMLVCWVIFSSLRVSAFGRRFYAPRRYAKDIDLKPIRLPSKVFGWSIPLLRYPEEDIIDEVGLDAAIYCRIQMYGLILFTFTMLWTLIVVLPVNATADNVDALMATNVPGSSTNYKFTDFDKLALTNIPEGSQLMWVHLISTYVVACAALWLLWKFSKEAVLLRIMFLANSKRGGPSHTVLVTDIPGVAALRSENAAALKKMAAEEKKLAAEDKKKRSGKSVTSESASEGLTPAASALPPADSAPAELPPAAEAATDSEATAAGGAPGTERKGSKYVIKRENKQPAAVPKHKYAPGLSPEEIEMELHEERLKTAGPPSRRVTKRFNYDLRDTRLDPLVQVSTKLVGGMSPEDMVKEEFDLVYSSKVVAAVNMVYDQSVLGPLVAEYDGIVTELEDFLSMADYRLKLRREIELPKTLIFNPKKWGEWGISRYGTKLIQKVDALDFWSARLEELSRLIADEQDRAHNLMAPSAFVTFNTRTAQCTAAAALHHHDELAWRVANAPAPMELVWQNLGLPTSVKSSSNAIMWVVFWLMAMFFMIPVTAIQGLIDVPNLAKVPGLKDFVNAPVVKQLLQAIIPGLALKIFLAIVPLLLRIMMIFSGAVSDSEIDFGVVTRYFLFQIIVVFFGSVIASSFFNQLKKILDDPSSLVQILGAAIPQSATFFITFIFVTGLGTQAISFLRVVGLVLYWVFSKIAGSPRKRERIWSEQYTTFGVTVVAHTINFMLGLIYCIINPIITIATFFHFLVGVVTERYNQIYVYRRTYESAGKLWQTVFTQIMISLYLFEGVMIALLSIKKFKFSPILIPLLLGTAIFHVSTMTLFNRPWNVTSLHDAAELDVLEAKERRAAAAKKAREEAKAAAAAGGGAAPTVALSLDTALSAGTLDIPEPVKGAEGLPLLTEVEIPPMTEEEKKEIAEMYLSPVFKVELDEVPRLVKAAKSAKARIEADVERRLAIKALQGDEKAIALQKEKEERKRAKEEMLAEHHSDDDESLSEEAAAAKAVPSEAV